jgi:hypothetical protein
LAHLEDLCGVPDPQVSAIPSIRHPHLCPEKLPQKDEEKRISGMQLIDDAQKQANCSFELSFMID